MPAGCTGGPGPGLVALQVFLCAKFGTPRTGPYACRNVRGGSGISLHGLGRAADLPTNANNATGLARGNAIVAWCMAHWAEIGGDELIWNRQITTDGRTLRPYGGGTKSPHTDHVHVGISQAKAWGAGALTGAGLSAIDSGAAAPAGETQPPDPAGATNIDQGAVNVGFPGADHVGALFGALTSKDFWLRVLKIVAGGVITLAGILVAMRSNLAGAAGLSTLTKGKP